MKLGRDRATTTKKLDQTDQKRANTNPPPNLRTNSVREKSVIRVPLDDVKATTYLWYLNYAYYTKLDFFLN